MIFTGNILKQPMAKKFRKKISKGGYPNADYVMESGVLLPLHHGMTNEMFSRLHSVIESFLKKYV